MPDETQTQPEQRRWTVENQWCEECGWQTVADGPDIGDERIEVMPVAESEDMGRWRERALAVVALLLREGWTAAQVSAAMKVTDAGGSVADAFAAMREAK